MADPRPRLAGIHIYPVKSCGGIELQRAELGDRGLRYDRRYMLVDGAGRFLSQRRLPRMALVSASISGDAMRLIAPGMAVLELPLEPAASELGPRLPVRVFGDVTEGTAVGAEADRWFGGFLQAECRLVYMPDDAARPVDPRYADRVDRVSFADGFPLLLFSEASLADLNSRLPEPVPEDRFRPNLVVSGAEAFEEDGWRRVRVGEVTLRVAKPCSRCTITTVEQSTGEKGQEPLRTLARYRRIENKVVFGQNLLHDAPGELAVEQPVEVLERA